MKVNKELIAKYHNGDCTPEETAVVENWLFNEETEDIVLLPETVDKEKIKIEMWGNITDILPSTPKKYRIVGYAFTRTQGTTFIAAASMLLLLVASVFHFGQNTQQSVISSVNASLINNKEIDARDYTISLGPESNARIDAETGLIDFCGTILISPKKDIFLSFKDICTTSSNNTGKMNFKKGGTYIALNYRNKKDNEVVVMEEKLLMGLPPVLKRQIMNQFNI